MNLASDKTILPPPEIIADQIQFNNKKFNDYPYLILALLDKVPELRELSDESVTLYHHSVRKRLANKYNQDTVLTV